MPCVRILYLRSVPLTSLPGASYLSGLGEATEVRWLTFYPFDPHGCKWSEQVLFSTGHLSHSSSESRFILFLFAQSSVPVLYSSSFVDFFCHVPSPIFIFLVMRMDVSPYQHSSPCDPSGLPVTLPADHLSRCYFAAYRSSPKRLL